MKIAVTSQDRAKVTGHAGRCQSFWVYEVEEKTVRGRTLLEVPPGETFHESHHAGPPGLAGISALITGSMGQGLANRLAQQNIAAVITSETDPDRAVAAWLAGALSTGAPHACHGPTC